MLTRHLALCGIKHSGKSSIGKLLAQNLNCAYRDTDKLLEEKFHLPIRELYRAKQEELFRQLEQEVILETVALEYGVISLGGGALKLELNVQILRQCAYIIWLDVDDLTCFERITSHGIPPFLNSSDPFMDFQRQNRIRRQIFSSAANIKFTPQGDKSIEDNTKELWEQLKDMKVV